MTDAMVGLATGNREGKPAEREQTILTPDCIWDVVRDVLGTAVCDPCPVDGTEGLTTNWLSPAYINPPYKGLKAWLAKSSRELEAGVREQILLFPVRPNRAWWCEYMVTWPQSVAWLKPLKFKGYTSSFPAPLVLVYTGEFPSNFERAVRPLACHVGGPL